MPVPAFRSAHHARLASGCWLGSTGWACLPTGFLRKVSVMFSYIAFSFPKLSWRRRRPLLLLGLLLLKLREPHLLRHGKTIEFPFLLFLHEHQSERQRTVGA